MRRRPHASARYSYSTVIVLLRRCRSKISSVGVKPYGFSIHGCIDGFSRKVLWLEVETSNEKPEIVAKFYLKCVEEAAGIPVTLKVDDGTAHSIIEQIHAYLTGMTWIDKHCTLYQ